MNTDLDKLKVTAARRTAAQVPADRDIGEDDLRSYSDPADCVALQRIEAALRKLDHGSYGYCESCGGEISIRKLDADPTRAFCGNCGG